MQKFPESVTVTVCLVYDLDAQRFSVKDYFSREDFDENGLYTSEYSKYLYAGEHEVTLPVEIVADPVRAQIAALDEEERDAKAKLAALLTDIARRRNNLLAIDMDPALTREGDPL